MKLDQRGAVAIDHPSEIRLEIRLDTDISDGDRFDEPDDDEGSTTAHSRSGTRRA